MTGISRSGRVRKKSSKLVDFRSPDDIGAEKALKRSYTHKSPSTKSTHRSPASHKNSTNPTNPTSKSTIKSYFQPVPKFSHSNSVAAQLPSEPHPPPSTPPPLSLSDKNVTLDLDFIDAEKEIDMLLSPSKYSIKDENPFMAENNNEVDSDEDFGLTIDTTVRQSAYMSEKSTKKKIYRDGEIIMAKPQRKDKGKPRYTAYMLWAKEVRQDIMKSNPDMDFSQASRRLSSLWANVSSNEKHIWRRRAKRVTIKNKKALKTGDKPTLKYLNKKQTKGKTRGRKPKNPDAIAAPSPTKKAKATDRKLNGFENQTTSRNRTISAHSNNSNYGHTTKTASANISDSSRLATITPGAYKITGIGPTDVAAHLKLLGDNLTLIGQRLKEHEVNKFESIRIKSNLN